MPVNTHETTSLLRLSDVFFCNFSMSIIEVSEMSCVYSNLY